MPENMPAPTPPPESSKTGVDVEVRRGAPTSDELAAIVAVVTEAYEREAIEAVAVAEPRRSAWQISTTGLRTPLRREIGWGRFGG